MSRYQVHISGNLSPVFVDTTDNDFGAFAEPPQLTAKHDAMLTALAAERETASDDRKTVIDATIAALPERRQAISTALGRSGVTGWNAERVRDPEAHLLA